MSARKILILHLCAFLLIATTSRPASAETLIAEIRLNSQLIGEFFLETSPDGEYFIRKEDFDKLGLIINAPQVVTIQQEEYVPLNNISGMSASLIEETLTLDITVDPELLPGKKIDLTTRFSQDIAYPNDSSLFLNYGLSYIDNGLIGENFFELPHEFGARYRDTLFLSDGIYSNAESSEGYIRLMSGLVHDNRLNMNRTQLGDTISTSGKLGSQINLGGIRFSRNYNIDPYFIEYPTARYRGVLTSPSTVDVFLDGVRIYSERLPPGPFELSNIHRHSGSGSLEVIITDAFGNERKINHPFYIEDTLLKKGAHGFNYAAGALRENFGTESNAYGESAFQAVHRYGATHNLTLGGALEGGSDLVNGRILAASLLGPYGIVEFEAGGSSGYDESGTAAALEYNYLSRHFNGRFEYQLFSEGFRRISDRESPSVLVKNLLALGAGFVHSRFGSLSFDYFKRDMHLGNDQTVYTASYNRRLARNLNMSSTYRHTDDGTAEDSIFFSLNYTPWRETQLTALVEHSDSLSQETLQFQKHPPIGEGYGYLVALSHVDNTVDSNVVFETSGRYQGRYGAVSADIENSSGDNSYTSYQLKAAGSVLMVGRHWGFSRPVNDSFALVSVGDLGGVDVFRNSHTSGQTDENGYLFLPELSSFYTNQVAIDDQSIPLNYTLTYRQRLISPPYRSGSCVFFPTVRQQPIVGHLEISDENGPISLDYTVQQIVYEGNRYPLHIGRGGEFYLDPSELTTESREVGGCEKAISTVQPINSYLVEISYGGEVYPLEIDVPESDELFVDVGTIRHIIQQ